MSVYSQLSRILLGDNDLEPPENVPLDSEQQMNYVGAIPSKSFLAALADEDDAVDRQSGHLILERSTNRNSPNAANNAVAAQIGSDYDAVARIEHPKLLV